MEIFREVKREMGGERMPRGTGTQAVAIKHRGREGLSDTRCLLPLHMLVYVYQESIFVSMFLEFSVSSTVSHGGG